MSDDDGRDRSRLFDAPERATSWLGDLVRENFKTLLGIGAGVWLLSRVGVISLPNLGIPLWARVVGTFGVLAAGGGVVLAKLYFDDQEPDWSRIVEVNIDDPHTPRISKVTDAVLADLTVVGGRLRSPQGSSIYVCRWWNRDAEDPVAHCTWRDLPDDAELLGVKPSAIEDEIVALRDTYEDTHGRHKWVLDHLWMVIRRLDFRRSKRQNAVLEDHTAPSMEDETISEAVGDIIPDELQPDTHQATDPDGVADRAVDEVADELEEPEPEAVGAEPVAPDGGAETDG